MSSNKNQIQTPTLPLELDPADIDWLEQERIAAEAMEDEEVRQRSLISLAGAITGQEIKNFSEAIAITSRVREAAVASAQRALQHERDIKFDQQRIVELGTIDPDTVRFATERVLAGKNTAIVFRRGSYADLTADILAPMEETGLEQTGYLERFPNSRMRAQRETSSSIHLDNFADGATSHFKYAASVSRVQQGEVLFVGGKASQRAKGLNVGDYNVKFLGLNNSASVTGLRRSATAGHPKKSGAIAVAPDVNPDKQLDFVTLQTGDVVLWAQGGPGSEVASWHGFFQVGDISRQSVTRHFIKTPNAQITQA